MPNQVSAWGACGATVRCDAKDEYDRLFFSSSSHTPCISFDIMVEPTMAADGHTYEKTAIIEWLSKSSQSPITGEEIDPSVLLPNHLARSQICEYLASCK